MAATSALHTKLKKYPEPSGRNRQQALPAILGAETVQARVAEMPWPSKMLLLMPNARIKPTRKAASA
jgi:hypothetical protein